MEAFLKIIGAIAIPILVFLIFGVFATIFYWYQDKNRRDKYENYDREPSEEELDFIKLIQEQLFKHYETLSNQSLFFRLIPYWALAFVLGLSAALAYSFFLTYEFLVELTNSYYSGAISVQRFDFGISIIFFGLTAVCFVCWLFYHFIKFSVNLETYIALNSDVWGWNAADVHERQIELVVHKLRANLIRPSNKFDAEAFLKSRNSYHQKIYLVFTAIFFVLASICLFFDLSYVRAVYPDKLVTSGSYFSIAEVKEREPSVLVDKVYIHCQGQNGYDLSAEYRLKTGEDTFATIPILESNIEDIYMLDKTLRVKDVTFDPHQHVGNRKYTDIRYTYCVGRFAENSVHRELWLETMHFQQALENMEKEQLARASDPDHGLTLRR